MNLFEWKKPTNCNCGPGGYRIYGESWRVIERRESPKSSKLKCMTCGWRWWSSCGYVANLPDHVEKHFASITDQGILDRINEGTLVVLVNVPSVWSYSQKGWVELKIIDRSSNGSYYRFVDIFRNSSRKKIALHRLVWMFANRSLVPEGYDVDHIEGKLIERADAIDNLQLLESSHNRSRGKPRVVDPAQEELPF